jgi:hypothetical protein
MRFLSDGMTLNQLQATRREKGGFCPLDERSEASHSRPRRWSVPLYFQSANSKKLEPLSCLAYHNLRFCRE